MKTCIGIDMSSTSAYLATATLQNSARLGEWLTLKVSQRDGVELALHMTRAQAKQIIEILLQPQDKREDTSAAPACATIDLRATDGTYSLIAVNVPDNMDSIKAAILIHGPGVYRVNHWRGGTVINQTLLENPPDNT